MANERNALDVLADRMRKYIDEAHQSWSFRHDALMAQRIVAELAKADYIYAADPVTNNCVKLQLEAFKNCRAIAEGEE